MKTSTVDILLSIGIPAGVKGFNYICDAMEIFDSDPYYADGKICALYHDIAQKHNTTSSRVERAMRHAFETALLKGVPEKVDYYLDQVNTQNSNLLRTLYIRIKQDQQRKIEEHQEPICTSENCAIRQQIYQEVIDHLAQELDLVIEKFSIAGI